MGLGERAEQAGVVAEPGGGDLEAVKVGRGHDVAAHGGFDGIQDQVAAEGDPAAEDDDGGVEDMEEIRRGLADKGTGTDEGFFCKGVAFPGGFGDRPGGEGGLALQERVAAFIHLLADVFDDGRTGGNGFKMTADAARANGPAGEDGNMTEFGGHAAVTLHQDISDDGGPAQAGADGQVNQVVVTLAGAVLPFSQEGQVGIVPQEDGNLVLALEQLRQGIIRPGGDVGGLDDDAGVGVERAGGGHGDGVDGVLRPGGVDEGGQAVVGALFHAAGGGTLDGDGSIAVVGENGDP